MSIHEIDTAILADRLQNKWMETPGLCRKTAMRMYEVATAADVSAPRTKIELLAYPKAQTSETTHYALRVSSADQIVIFNPSPTPRFPQYIGEEQFAPGLLKEMIPVPEVL